MSVLTKDQICEFRSWPILLKNSLSANFKRFSGNAT